MDLLNRILVAAQQLADLGVAKTNQERARHEKLARALERAIQIKVRPPREPWIPSEDICPACKARVNVRKNGELYAHDLTHGQGCRYNGKPDEVSYQKWWDAVWHMDRHRLENDVKAAKERVKGLQYRLTLIKTEKGKEKLQTMLDVAQTKVAGSERALSLHHESRRTH